MNRGAQCARRWVVVLCAIMSLLQHAAAECGHSQPAVLHQQRQLLHMFNEDMAAADRQEAATASVVRESALLTSQHTRSLLGHPSTSPHWRRQGGRQLHLAQLLAQSKPARIRIRPIYQLHESDFLSGMGQDAERYMQVVVASAIRVIEKFVQVRVPHKGPLLSRLPAGSDCGATVIGRHLSRPAGGAGVQDADLVLYVSAMRRDGCPEMAVGYATACDWDPVTLRPTVAALNICPRSARADVNVVEENVGAFVHELMHALGFYVELFPSFYDSVTGKQHPRPVTTVNGRTYLSTPKVKAQAQQHFACPSLPGAPLEEWGGSGSASSHWEAVQLQHEIVTPIQTEDSQRYRMSNFTLALLDDTGFYVPNYRAAQAMDWGYKAGCAFVTQPVQTSGCIAFSEANPRRQELCRLTPTMQAGKEDLTCSYDSRVVVACAGGKSSPFSNGCELGVSDSAIPFSCSDPGSFGDDFKRPHAAMGLTVGARDSRCFSLRGGVACAKTAGGTTCTDSTFLCARAKCSAAGEPILIVRLPTTGRDVELLCNRDTLDLAQALPGHFTSGVLNCPGQTMCASLTTCGPCNKGTCWQGKCTCHFEAIGPACNHSLIHAIPKGYQKYRE